jgi:hypothetical protein
MDIIESEVWSSAAAILLIYALFKVIGYSYQERKKKKKR